MARRVFRSPDSSDPDKAPWERTHPKLRAARRDAAKAGKRPAQAVLDKLNRARRARGRDSAEAGPTDPSPDTTQGDDARDRSDPASSFWSAASTGSDLTAVATPDEFISGEEEFFDPSTGWDFQAITNRQIEAVRSQEVAVVADSGEFSLEIDADEPIPPPGAPPLDAEHSLTQAQELFQQERDLEAITLLDATSRAAPDDPRLTTWIEFGERRVMRRCCPTGGLDRVPRIARPPGEMLPAADPAETGLLLAIDGASNAATLRQRLGLGAVEFWAPMGKLVERGWILWIDDA